MHVVVVNVHGCHLGYLGCYGNEWVATPNLDRLAAHGVVFDQHYRDALDERESRTAWTGQWQGGAPLPEVLAQAGMAWGHARLNGTDGLTAALHDLYRQHQNSRAGIFWIDGPNLAPPWKLPEELESIYTEDEDLLPVVNPPDEKPADDEVVAAVQCTYAAAITFLDAQIGALNAFLNDSEWARDAVLIFTASSGLTLYEHGQLGEPGSLLHEESIHLPLVWRLFDGRFAGLRVGALTQPMDLAPSLCNLLGIVSTSKHGRDLTPILRGEIDALRSCAISFRNPSTTLRSLDWAYLIGPGTRSLYAKPEDRWEVNDLVQKQPELVESLDQAIGAYWEEMKGEPVVDQESTSRSAPSMSGNLNT